MLLKTLVSALIRRSCSTSVSETASHLPVMVEESLEYLKPVSANVILDMTFGAGGHSKKILESNPTITLLAADRDPICSRHMEQLSEMFPGRVVPLLGKFSDVPHLLKQKGIGQNSLDAILFDFGCSSMQFDIAERGFAISKNGPLDMRMDGDRNPDSPTAADVLAQASEGDLYRIIKYYGEEKMARKIARAIIEARYMFKKLTTTDELAELVDYVCGNQVRLDKLQRRSHNATKTFQALRIFVNNELNEINYGMIIAQRYLKLGGRLVAITFHSLEDTIVKRHLMGNVVKNTANTLPLKYCNYSTYVEQSVLESVMELNWKMLHKHVILPSLQEVENNPRSRSAKLRAAVRIK